MFDSLTPSVHPPPTHPPKEADERAPKLLAALSKDNSPINIVRFSPSQYRTLEGKSALLVAWGSDDDTVNVAELTPGAAQRSFAATVSCPNVENWRLVRAYQGKNFTPHLGEEALVVGVVDLAWSPPIERGDKETVRKAKTFLPLHISHTYHRITIILVYTPQNPTFPPRRSTWPPPPWTGPCACMTWQPPA